MNCPYVVRRCRKCGEVKFLFKFVKRKEGKHGFENRCKECRAEYQKKYRQSEHSKEYQKEYNQKYRQSERGKEYRKEYRQSEKGKESRKKYRQSERGKEREKEYRQSEKGKEAQKRYRQSEKGKEVQKRYNQTAQGQVVQFNKRNRRRSKEQEQGNGITEMQWLEMMNFFEWKCAYSDIQLNKNTRSVDHVIALDNGGLNEIWNCVPMYRPHNSGKKAKDMLEWYQQQDFYSEERLQKIYEWQEYAYNKWNVNI